MKTKRPIQEAIEVPLPHSSSDEEDEETGTPLLNDEDTCSPAELEQQFRIKYKITDEKALTLRKDYVLSLCKDRSFTRVVAGLSNGVVKVFDGQNGLHEVHTIPAPSGAESISSCGVRFLDDTPHNLLVGTSNGLIRMIDLRSNEEVARFEEDIESTQNITGAGEWGGGTERKQITCFDSNANGRVLCVGTEQYQKNVFLLFFDVRERKQLGGYYESHEDDVTAVRFHEENPDLLCSGGTDGLINVYDIKETSEDDALLTTINTESSVQKLNWHKNVYDKDVVSCITHTNDLKMYLSDEGDLAAEFERIQITEGMKRKNEANCNAVNVHNLADGGVFLLAGTNINKGEILRSLQVQNKQLLPLANFEGNKQIVRESIYDAKLNILVTGGESGIVSLWTPSASDSAASLESGSSQLKSKSKHKSKKKTPY